MTVASVPEEAAKVRSDVLLLYAARGVRGFGDGFAVIILPAYLSAIGYEPARRSGSWPRLRCSARRC